MASVSKQKPFSQVGPPATIQTDSQFLRLPPEIRNMVYELVFQDHVTMMPCYGKTTTIGSGKIIAPGLLRTCKQVHYEALSMYYNLATFLFTRATTRRAKQWIKTIGDARVALVSNACFPTRYLGWLSDRTHDKHARESAGMARRFLLQAKLELNPLSAALKSRIELAPDVYFATASPLQLVEEILKISEWNWRYGRYWTSQPSEELKRLLPFWTTIQDVELKEEKRKVEQVRSIREKVLESAEKALVNAEKAMEKAQLEASERVVKAARAKAYRDYTNAKLLEVIAHEKELR